MRGGGRRGIWRGVVVVWVGRCGRCLCRSDLVSVVGAGGLVRGGQRTEEEAFPDLEKFDGGEGTAGAEVGL